MNIDGTDRIKELLNQVTAADDQGGFPPLTPAETLVKGRLTEEPSQPEALLTFDDEALLTRKTVGAFVAAGGIGKTTFMGQLAAMMAAAGQLGPIRAPKPLKVLFLPGEDPQSEIDRRLWKVCQGDFPDGFYAASVSGKVGPLMHLDAGNPMPSESYDWLCRTVENHVGLDVLMIDPKSRFYGLEENNNDHCTQWISYLERIANEYNVTVLFSHHVSKGKGKALDQDMSRGGSAIADGVRWLMAIVPMSDDTARRYGVDPRGFIEMDLVKANYVPKLPKPLFFERDSRGVLHYRDLGGQYLNVMTQQLALLLKEYNMEPTRRELRTDIGKDVCDRMKDHFGKFTKSRDVDLCINHAIRKDWMEETDIGTKKNPRKIIRVKCTAW